MKSILDALKKFIKGEIDSDQLLAEFSFNLSECLSRLTDESLKDKLLALKKELYKADADLVKITQMAKVCYEELKKLLDLDDESEDERDFGKKEAAEQFGSEASKTAEKRGKASADSFYDGAFLEDNAKAEEKAEDKTDKKKKSFGDKISEKLENAENRIDDVVTKVENSFKAAGEKIKNAFRGKK